MDSILTADTVPLASVPDFGASREATFAHIVQPSGYFVRFVFLYYAPTKKVRIKALPSGSTGGEFSVAPGLRYSSCFCLNRSIQIPLSGSQTHLLLASAIRKSGGSQSFVFSLNVQPVGYQFFPRTFGPLGIV